MNKENIPEYPGSKGLDKLQELLIRNGISGFSEGDLIRLLLYFGGSSQGDIRTVTELLCKEGGAGKLLYSTPEIRRQMGISDAFSSFLTLFRLAVSRYACSKYLNRPVVDASQLKAFFRPIFFACPNEEFFILCLDTDRMVKDIRRISQGNSASALVDLSSIGSAVSECRAAYAAVAHNHPLSDPEPSDADIELTRNMILLLKHVGTELIDHIIVGYDSEFSLKEDSEQCSRLFL